MSPARRESIAGRVAVGVAVTLVGAYITASTAAHWRENERLAAIETLLQQRAVQVDRLLQLHHERLGELERRTAK